MDMPYIIFFVFLKNKTVDLFTYCQLQLFFKKNKKQIAIIEKYAYLAIFVYGTCVPKLDLFQPTSALGSVFFYFFISLELLYYFSWLVKNPIGICILFFFFFFCQGLWCKRTGIWSNHNVFIIISYKHYSL